MSENRKVTVPLKRSDVSHPAGDAPPTAASCQRATPLTSGTDDVIGQADTGRRDAQVVVVADARPPIGTTLGADPYQARSGFACRSASRARVLVARARFFLRL